MVERRELGNDMEAGVGKAQKLARRTGVLHRELVAAVAVVDRGARQPVPQRITGVLPATLGEPVCRPSSLRFWRAAPYARAGWGAGRSAIAHVRPSMMQSVATSTSTLRRA